MDKQATEKQILLRATERPDRIKVPLITDTLMKSGSQNTKGRRCGRRRKKVRKRGKYKYAALLGYISVCFGGGCWNVFDSKSLPVKEKMKALEDRRREETAGREC